MYTSTDPNLISSHSHKGARRFFEQIAALYVFPFLSPSWNFENTFLRLESTTTTTVPNVKGHSCFLFSALTILFASWLASRFVPTRNIKLCQGKTTVSRECFQHLFFPPFFFLPSLPPLPSSFVFFSFIRFFLA